MIAHTPCDERLGHRCTQSAHPTSASVLLAAVVLGSCMAFVDATVVNVALPVIQKDFRASLAAMQWVLNGYTLILGAFILIGGSLGDHLGRRKVFIWGVVLFAIASLLCGLAANVATLVAARMLQGVGGAMLVPGSLSIITSAFPEQERGKAIGVWAAGSAISTAIGPLLGGWLVDNVSWRAVFFINMPLAAATIFLAIKGIPETKDEGAGKIDWLSAFLAVLALGGISYGLIQAPEDGWTSSSIIAAFIVGLGFFTAFLWRQIKSKQPMVPPDLFRSRTFSGVNVMTLLLYGALAGSLFFVPFNLIQVRHYSAAEAGASFLPFTILMGGFSRWAGTLVTRYGSRPPLILGPAIVAVGFLALSLGRNGDYWASVFPGITLIGVGMTITVAPLTTTVMGSIPSEKAGIASGINNAVSRVAGLLAVAALGSVMVAIYTNSLMHNVGANQVSNANQLLTAPMPSGLSGEMKAKLAVDRTNAFLDGYRIVMWIAAGLAGASAAVAGFTVGSVKPNGK